jgi:hypothetical protein
MYLIENEEVKIPFQPFTYILISSTAGARLTNRQKAMLKRLGKQINVEEYGKYSIAIGMAMIDYIDRTKLPKEISEGLKSAKVKLEGKKYDEVAKSLFRAISDLIPRGVYALKYKKHAWGVMPWRIPPMIMCEVNGWCFNSVVKNMIWFRARPKMSEKTVPYEIPKVQQDCIEMIKYITNDVDGFLDECISEVRKVWAKRITEDVIVIGDEK